MVSNNNFDLIDFPALNLTTPASLHFNRKNGKLQTFDLTKNRPCTDCHFYEPVTLEIQESQIKEARSQNTQSTFLPTHAFLMSACKLFYVNTSLRPVSHSDSDRHHGQYTQDFGIKTAKNLKGSTSHWLCQAQPRLESQVLLRTSSSTC